VSRLAFLTLWVLLFCGCQSKNPVPPNASSTPVVNKLEFVGSERCSGCHTEEADEWQDSHHHKAMARPTEETVLGDFNNSEFDYFGFRTKFFKQGDEFWVETDGPEGVSAKYKIEYTFGFEPLQQYLIKFPDGRLQALSISWDTKEQKWFHLHPDQQITAGSSLHWTSPQYNWNFMCAECHSTGVEKNYAPLTDTYDTAYKEINVSCESCHGPGSGHLKSLEGERLPHHGFSANLKGHGPWKPQTQKEPPQPENLDRPSLQIETCARCHARRSVISEPYQHGQPLSETHPVSVLSEELYHSDGQIKDEVYVYGSFLQSKMYQAGVVCTDCHDPHTTSVKIEGDGLCLQCHTPQTYKVESHSHHKTVSCVDCHMVGKLYMGNDYRRDHSFRIPRPDLSKELNSPNACTTCHQDKSLEWNTEAYLTWYGEGQPHYGQVFHQGRTGDPRARKELAKLASDSSKPDIVRATAVSLAPFPEVVQPALEDTSDLVRREAVRALQGSPPDVLVQLLTPLADDPVRAVRVEVGRLLAGVSSESPQVSKAVDEYRESLRVNADRTESRLGLAALQMADGNPKEAEKTFLQSLERDPTSAMAYINLADFYRATGRDKEGETLLRAGLEKLPPPEAAPLHYSLGLLLIREKRYPDALKNLEKASKAAPLDTRMGYVYAVGLQSVGKTEKAIEELERLLDNRPFDLEILSALISFLEEDNRAAEAQAYGKRLQEIREK
jgi:predicted CXXCH cytochrome family protein